LENKIVKERLDAKKHLGIMPLNQDPKLEVELGQRAWDLSCDGQSTMRCIVFCNERRVLEKAKGAVEKLAKGDKKAGKAATEIDTELLVGGRRVFEREQARERLKELGFVASSKVERNRPAFLFATSAGEVGVDLDADHMVCDLVAWERMVQRLGRLNRRGEPEGHVSHIDVIFEPEPADFKKAIEKETSKRTRKDEDIIARVERTRATKKLLEQLPPRDKNRVEASPGALSDLKKRAETEPKLRELLDAATTPAPLRPALSRALVDAWSITSLKEHTGRPAINPRLRGWIEDDLPPTAIVWRRHLPVRTSGPPATRGEIEEFFEAAPPHTSELLETETFRLVEWLAGRAKGLLSPSSAASREDGSVERPPLRRQDTLALVLSPDGDLRKTLSLMDVALPEDREAARDRRSKLHEVLAAGTLIVDARVGGVKDGLLDAEERELPRTVDDGNMWLGEDVVRFRVRSAEAAGADARDAQWHERLRFAVEVSEVGEARRWLIVDKWRHDAATEEDRSAGRPQLLDEHQSWAECRARGLAKALQLDDYAEMLAVAARLHDEGKRASRWQRAFNAPTNGVYVKTEGPINYALLDSYRHELGSLHYVEKNERWLALPDDQRELALHLIAAHHGFARAVIGMSGVEDAPPSALEDRGREIALRFARLQECWGPWGLAWWESLLRAADQQASRDNDAQDSLGTGGGAG
jgi:CRISPR-associated endonuclease/helicase Cas3